MTFRGFAALAVALLACGLASAQPKVAEPTLELRLRSVNDLIARFEYIATLAGKDDAIANARDVIKVLSADGKGIEGIDPKKPLGLYATLTADVGSSPVIVMIPIVDKAQFVNALKARFNITAEKGEDGTLKIPLPPDVTPALDAVYARFTNDYLYLAQRAGDLAEKTLITPKAYFAKDDGAAFSLLVHLDRVPADLKTFLLGQFELGVNEERKKADNAQTEAEKKFQNWLFDSLLSGTKGLTDDGKQFSMKLFVEPKTDEISAEISFVAKSGSTTAKNFASLGTKTSLPAGIVATNAPAIRANAKFSLTDGMKKEYHAVLDAAFANALKNAPNDQEPVLKALIEAVSPTLKAGELDIAASLTGPDAKNYYTLVAALGVKEGKGIEKFVKKVADDYGAFIGDVVEFKFDVETIGEFSLHRIDLKQGTDKLEDIFNTKTIWLATSDATIVVSLEPNGDAIRKGLKAKAVSATPLSANVSLSKVVPLFKPDLKPDEIKALLKDAFGDNATGKDAVALTLEGGDKLTLKFKVNGKAIRFVAGYFQFLNK